MLVGVWKDALIARPGSDRGEAASHEPHVRRMDITGKPMKGWVLVGADGIEDDSDLGEWIQQATAFVEPLPAK